MHAEAGSGRSPPLRAPLYFNPVQKEMFNRASYCGLLVTGV